MKLLILTCSTGGGHTSAAKAIAEAARRDGVESDIVDALQFLPGVDGKLISHGHTFVYRHLPRMFGIGYRFERRGGARAFRVECRRGARSLGPYIAAGGYAAVVSVHIFSSFMLAKLRDRGELSIPVVNVATDYTCSPGFAECDLGVNCIPRGLSGEFISHGLEAGQLVETGIPVSSCYDECAGRAEARRMLGLEESGPLVLLMCGSMGCGPMEWLAGELSRALPEGGMIAALCGTNKKLRAALDSDGLPGLMSIGYTQQVSLWMDAADLIISKPGGLTSSEAMAKRLPMIIIDAVPGCETKNLEYLTARGCAVTAPTEEIPGLALSLLRSGAAGSMRANMEEYFPHGSAGRVWDAVCGVTEGKRVLV